MIRSIIGAIGLVGLGVAAYTASYYAGVDRLALAIALLIAAAFSVGIVELLRYVREIDALRGELSEVARKGTRAAVDGASPLLRGLLRARLDRVPLPVPAPTFAPFLVGLVVMLGLLGTFLGLFETLRGAHGALTTSHDIESLRAGLAAPMGGLMRSFGCSAAGVTSSACLGIALVFARRVGAAAALELHAAASGPLAAESAARRELEALERLAELASAWPVAAERLERTADTVASLADVWTRAHAEAAEKVSASQLAAIEELAEIQRRSADSLAATQTRASEATLAGVQRAAAELSESLRAGTERAAGSFAASLERGLSGLVERLAPIAEGTLRESLESLERHLGTVRELLSGESHVRAEAERALRAAFEAHVRALGERLEDERARERDAVAKLAEEVRLALSSIADREATRAEATAKAEDARAESLARLSSSIGADLAAASEALRARAEARAEAEAREAARIEALHARLDETAASVGAAAARQASALEAMVAAAEGRLRAAEESQDARLSSLLDRMAAAEEAQASRLAAFEERIGALHEKGALGLAGELTRHAEGLSKGLAETTEILREAAGLVHAGGAEMTAVAEGFAAAVEAQRDASRAWLESLGQVEAAVLRAGEGAAADVLGEHLAHTHEVFDRQLRFQTELFEQLRALRPSPARDS